MGFHQYQMYTPDLWSDLMELVSVLEIDDEWEAVLVSIALPMPLAQPQYWVVRRIDRVTFLLQDHEPRTAQRCPLPTSSANTYSQRKNDDDPINNHGSPLPI